MCLRYSWLSVCLVAVLSSSCAPSQPPAPAAPPAPIVPARPISSGPITQDPGIALLLGRHEYSDTASQTSFNAGGLWRGAKLHGSTVIEPSARAVCEVEQSYPDGRRIAVGGSRHHLDLVFGLGTEAAPSTMPASFSVTFDNEAEPHTWIASIFYRDSYLISLDDNEPDLLELLSHASSLKVSNQGGQDGEYTLEGSEIAIHALRYCLNAGHRRHSARGGLARSGATSASSAAAPGSPSEVDLDAPPAAPAPAGGANGKPASGPVDLDSP
jgi:hypothetical protein